LPEDAYDDAVRQITAVTASQTLPATNCEKKADDFARREYYRFSARRREYKEATDEAETIKQLEEAAKLLPGKRKSGRNECQTLKSATDACTNNAKLQLLVGEIGRDIGI